MNAFSADWLALREPFDRAAREGSGLDLSSLADLQRKDAPLSVLDLGSGTGANLRVLAPILGGAQHWRLVDHDPRLLAALPRAMDVWCSIQRLSLKTDPRLRIEGKSWSAELDCHQADLASELETLPFGDAQLVTTSALLDLVSSDWLDALLAKVCDAKAALLCALTVDGRIDWTPALPADAQIAKLFAAHQQRDKGLGGPALGAGAVARAVERLDALGYRCVQASSDWMITSGAMLNAMIHGLAEAALEQDPGSRDMVLTWRLRRLALSAQTSLRIGHQELLALPSAA